MFRTEVEIPKVEFEINYRNPIMTLGSCFAENIGKAMTDSYLDVDVNPFGVLFNPMSIYKSLEILLNEKIFSEEDLFEYKGIWNSFAHSSKFCDTNMMLCLEKINSRLEFSANFLKKTDFLMLTFGTAWIYEEKSSGSVVSNCHKLSASNFSRHRLTVDEIVAVYTELIQKLAVKFPSMRIIFSVSPVRHWKDTPHGNNLSKSTLLLAIDRLCSMFGNTCYFPSYEIQLDELRDYRFYANDMLHPSELAVEYIWKKFSESIFDDETNTYLSEVEQFNRDINHKPFFPASEEFEVFSRVIKIRKEKLAEKYPELKSRLK